VMRACQCGALTACPCFVANSRSRHGAHLREPVAGRPPLFTATRPSLRSPRGRQEYALDPAEHADAVIAFLDSRRKRELGPCCVAIAVDEQHPRLASIRTKRDRRLPSVVRLKPHSRGLFLLARPVRLERTTRGLEEAGSATQSEALREDAPREVAGRSSTSERSGCNQQRDGERGMQPQDSRAMPRFSRPRKSRGECAWVA
jgi:hypothetical protein